MVTFLNPDGYLVISLPHTGHAGVMSCLINGDFEYREHGLLDRTHLRFFGLKNIEALFVQANLKIIEARYVIKPPEETEFDPAWPGFPCPVRRDPRTLRTPESTRSLSKPSLIIQVTRFRCIAPDPSSGDATSTAHVSISKYTVDAEQEIPTLLASSSAASSRCLSS